MYRDGPHGFGPLVTRGGEPMPRPAGCKTPCVHCPKIPPGADPVPESAAELTPELERAVEHYRECRAVGAFPDDPLVRWSARLIRAAEDAAERSARARDTAAAVGRAVAQSLARAAK